MHTRLPDVGEDVSDLLSGAHVIAKCPVCEATLREPETVIDADGEPVYEGATNYWCPACGWEAPEENREGDDDD